MNISRPLLLLSCLAVIISPTIFALPTAVPMTLEELIETSESIVVATVQTGVSRWNTRQTLIVTDYELSIEEVLSGDPDSLTIVTLGGGTVGDETHEVSAVLHPEIGGRYLMFIEDTRRELFGPFGGGGSAIIGQTISGEARINAYQSWAGSVRSDDQKPTFIDVVQHVRTAIIDYQGRQIQQIDQPQQETPDVSNGKPALRNEESDELPFKRYERRTDHSEPDAELPIATPDESLNSPTGLPVSQLRTTWEQSVLAESQGTYADAPVEPDYYWARRPSPPVVFDPLPLDWHWSPYDQYMMSEWNRYGGGFFRVTDPDGTWAWGNGRFELAGFPPDSQMIAQFGEPWPPGRLAVAYTRWIGNGNIIESDIALNPAYGWTLSVEYGTRTSNSVWNFQQTMLHELGHAWGLKHPWEHQDVWWDSVMNYASKSYRIPLLLTDDTNAVRSAYSQVAMHDAVLGFYTTEDNTSSNHPFYLPTSPVNGQIFHGETLTFDNSIKLENTGTDVFSDPEIEIYLTPQRYSWANASYLKTANYSLDADPYQTWHLGLGEAIISSGVVPGRYYPAIFLRSDDDYIGNNSAWSTELDFVQVRNIPELLVIEEFWKTTGFSGSISSGGFYEALAALDEDVYYDFSICPNVGGSANFDTVIEIRTADGFILLTFNDDHCGLLSQISDFKPPATGTYRIRVRAWSDVAGIGSFNVAYRAQDTFLRIGFE